MLKEVLYKLDIIAPLIALLVTAALYFRRKHIRSFSSFILISFLGLQLVLNSIAGYLHFILVNNLWVYHVNCLVTYLLFTYYFTRIASKKAIIISFLVFAVIEIYLISFVQTYKEFPSYSYAVAAFSMVIYGLLFLNKIIDDIPTYEILSLKEFWLITGILTYFGSNFLIFISFHYLSEVSGKNVSIIWQLHNVFLALSCFIFLRAIRSKQWMIK